MKIIVLLSLYISVFLSGTMNIVGQTAGPLNISYVRDEPIESDSPHAIGRRKVTFQITNRSSSRLTIFGEKDKNGFQPTMYAGLYEEKEGKFLFSNDEVTPPGFDELEPEEKMRMFLKPNKSFEFEGWLEVNCLTNRSKVALYYQENGKGPPKIAISDEIVFDISWRKCGSK